MAIGHNSHGLWSSLLLVIFMTEFFFLGMFFLIHLNSICLESSLELNTSSLSGQHLDICHEHLRQYISKNKEVFYFFLLLNLKSK